MSHSFSFLVSRNTQLNKAAMGCLFWRLFVVLFGDLFVVLFGDLFVVLFTIYNDVLAPLIGVQYTIYNNTSFDVARDRSI
jgi:hypothetical protein